MKLKRPQSDLRTFLISTPSSFHGAYISDKLRITPAATQLKHDFGIRSEFWESPFYRSYISAEYISEVDLIDEIEKDSYKIHTDDAIRICMAVLFGKRIENKGFIVWLSTYHMPFPEVYDPIWLYEAGPFNHSPRKDLGIGLDLSNLEIMKDILEGTILDQESTITFLTAGRFYYRALLNIEDYPEIAFIDLISCGEVLAQALDFPEDQLFDEDLKNVLSDLGEVWPGDDRRLRIIRKRLFQVKKRFTLTITRLLNDRFFEGYEGSTDRESVALAPEDIERRIKAAYDLRSDYLHKGYQFGRWLLPHREFLNEIHGSPPIEKKTRKQRDLAKQIELCPTLLGLERIMRYCLLRFIHLYGGVKIDDRLND